MREGILWPNNARCAVMFSFDTDGELLYKQQAPGQTWPWPRSTSVGRYGPTQGVPRILDILDNFGVKASFFTPAATMEKFPDVFQDVFERGHELAHHGYFHELYSDLSIDEQRQIITKSQDLFYQVVGERAIGYRTPSGDFTADSPRLIQEMGFAYSSSMRGDDRPYRTIIDGKESDLIEIPAQWVVDDYPYFGYNFYPPKPRGQDRVSSYRKALENWKMEFDGYYRYGLCYVIMCHPQASGLPGASAALEELLDYIKSFPDVWIATGKEIANWWKENY